MLTDKTLMKKGMRHLGGTNIGFADGHASWWNSERFLDEWAEEARAAGGWPGAFGLWAWGPMSWYQCGWGTNFAENSGGEPTLR